MLIYIILGLFSGVIFSWIVFWVMNNGREKKRNHEQSIMMAEAYAVKKLLSVKDAELSAAQEEMKMQQLQMLRIHTDNARLIAEKSAMSQKMEEKELAFLQLQKQMQTEFENTANKLLQESTQKLTESSQEKLGQMLTPLRETITSFEKRVEESYGNEARERFHLQKELENLLKLNQQLSSEAHSLTKALKGESKTQGNWGELVLTKILENSGLREGEEFIIQSREMNLKNEEGDRLQPDIVIQLPDNKHLIIDSKVSLTAYERYSSAESEIEKRAFMKKHVESISQHVQQLSAKHYTSLTGLFSPDFVLLFMPMESAFSAAISFKPDLFYQAFEKKIVIVSPTTLLATLKTVSSIWKLEQQNKNASEIARQGGMLYDKFMMFTEELEKVGKGLKNATDGYEKAVHRLSTGRDSLLNRAEKLRELGVKTSKKIPFSLNGNGHAQENEVMFED